MHLLLAVFIKRISLSLHKKKNFSTADLIVEIKTNEFMTQFKEVIVTLSENHYHTGVAALINSLCKSEFTGLIYIGYKGALPSWISQLENSSDEYFKIKSCYIKFSEIITDLHFGYYKPIAIMNIFDQYISAEKVYYFDSDIIVNAPWEYFKKWLDNGVSLCLDNCFPFVHYNHPWKKEWKSLSSSGSTYHCNYYVNSGFIGIEPADKLLIQRWIEITRNYQNQGGDITKFEKDGQRAIKGDQDLLNAAISVTPEINYSIIGTEGMGFTSPAYLMSHAVYDIKPWKKNFIKILLSRGHKPNLADHTFFSHLKNPIKVFDNKTHYFKRINLKTASILGRIIG